MGHEDVDVGGIQLVQSNAHRPLQVLGAWPDAPKSIRDKQVKDGGEKSSLPCQEEAGHSQVAQSLCGTWCLLESMYWTGSAGKKMPVLYTSWKCSRRSGSSLKASPRRRADLLYEYMSARSARQNHQDHSHRTSRPISHGLFFGVVCSFQH